MTDLETHCAMLTKAGIHFALFPLPEVMKRMGSQCPIKTQDMEGTVVEINPEETTRVNGTGAHYYFDIFGNLFFIEYWRG